MADQAIGDSGLRQAGYTLRERPRLPVTERTDWLRAARGLPPVVAPGLPRSAP